MLWKAGVFVCGILLLPFLLLAMSAPKPEPGITLSVSVRPRILLWGGDVRVECRVPRISTYEWVTFGIDGPDYFRASTEQLPGRVVYEMSTRMPANGCGTYYAFCVVQQGDALGAVAADPMPILMRGINCEEP